MTVLGTKFNVRSRNDVLDVTCQSGRVMVLDKEGTVLGELIANDALRFTETNDIEKWNVSPSEKPGWVNGIFLNPTKRCWMTPSTIIYILYIVHV